MNDPKDIILTITLDKEKEKENESEESNEEEEKKENVELNDESRFQILYIHLCENLSKRLYKKTIKEIDTLIETKYIEEYSCAWKITILKIRALAKIVKKKIVKYLIYHYEKAKLKNNIISIRNYLKKILNELNNFLNNLNGKSSIDLEIVDQLLLCYFEYIYLISFFHQKLGNVMNSVSYLSFILRLHKETQLLPKSTETFIKQEKCFILLCQMLIYNEDYFTCIEYLNMAMDLCLKSIIFQTKDLSEGVFLGDRKKLYNNLDEDNNTIMNKAKFEMEVENNYGDKKMKKIIMNVVCIYFYRGVCYENIGKMKNAIKCYAQCVWFLEHFFVSNYKNLTNLIKKILKKCIEFKETIDYVQKKIFFYEHLQKIKNQNKADKDKEEKKNKSSKELYDRKFKKLVNKIDKFKIQEIDTVNKFDIKKNIKSLNSVRREGKDKNIFLSDIRLLNTYLREDFRGIIDKMDIIKSYDLDYHTRERIQKLIRNLYFQQNMKNLRLKKKKNKNKFNHSSIDLNNNISSKYGNEYNNSKRYELFAPNNKQKIYKKIMVKSTFSKDNQKTPFIPYTSKSISKNQSIIFKNNSTISIYKNKNINETSKECKKGESVRKIKSQRLNSAGPSSRSRIYEENKELNSFFNKKYTTKRNYIKKLADRELTFQKSVLRLKNIPKTPIQMYNKELIKQNASYSFQKMMSLLIGTPMNWKEQMSEEEVKEIMAYDKLQNTVLRSLDNSAFARYKEEEKKQKIKSIHKIDGINASIKNIENNNKNLINKLSVNLEEIRQREIIENKNYHKLLIENRKNLQHKEHNYNTSCIVCKRINETSSRNNKLKKSYSSPYFYS